MNRWDRWTQYARGPKAPPPDHGIKMKKAGATWWGQQWISALEHVLEGDAGRLARGRTYARAGRVHDLVVKDGAVAAWVTGSRPKPYAVRIELAQLPEKAWARVVTAMAAEARFAAELLAGEMPKAIDEVFRAAKTSLFPTRRADLDTSCSCPDDGDPCKHVAAAHYVLGEAMDRDPFLLFELRGRTKVQVLEALRQARAKSGAPAAAVRDGAAPPAEAAVPRVTLGALGTSEYDRARGGLPSLHFSFEAPRAAGSMLRQLGAPAAWQGEESPDAVLGPVVQRAAETARRIAMAETDAQAPPPETPAVQPARAARAKKTKKRSRAK